jgi:hypothetical protein
MQFLKSVIRAIQTISASAIGNSVIVPAAVHQLNAASSRGLPLSVRPADLDFVAGDWRWVAGPVDSGALISARCTSVRRRDGKKN